MIMAQDEREFSRPPEEYTAPAAQITPPPKEYGEGGKSAPAAKKKRKYHYLAGALVAGVLTATALLGEGEAAQLMEAGMAASAPAAQVAQTTPELWPTGAPQASFTAAPTATSAALPQATPGIEAAFYRTSEVYHGQVTLIAPERLEGAVVRMVDRGLSEELWAHELTEEELAAGVYVFRDYDLFGGDYVQSHLEQLQNGYEPDPVLEIAYTVKTEGGSETVTRRLEAAYELWVSARYDLPDPEEDFLYYFMGETTYPDCFVVRVDETPMGGLKLIYGEGTDLGPGDVAVTLTVDGRPLPAEGARMEVEETLYEGQTFFSYRLILPRPEDFPNHGVAHVKISQRLIHFDLVAQKERDIEY